MSRTNKIIILVLLLLGVFAIGYWKGSGDGAGPESEILSQPVEADKGDEVKFWTCSMHPQIHQPGPGKCPICFMDLIPVAAEESEKLGPREIKLSEYARTLAQVKTAEVERRFVPVRIKMFGKIEFDESRVKKIAAWMAGRLDRLFVDYTGIPVEKGEHLVEIYSPELITAQEELLQAKRSLEELKNSKLASIQGTAERTVEAVREKLRLLGLNDSQIQSIEERNEPTDHITIYAPISGIVIHKNAVEGSYVDVGTEIYTIADMSKMWLMLDAYESDLVWIRYGQTVEFEVEAFPGEKFMGRISFIDPVLDEKTRTVKIRVDVKNEDSRLKPEMFASAVVKSEIAVEGKVMVPELAGKWICSMHPEIVKDNTGTCDICGMKLVRTETLGYASVSEQETTPPLVIPDSAPLITGERAVVYVENPDMEGVYESREIVLGARAEDYYIVREGLQEGEKVVAKGNFKIDSEAQIRAKKSMMSPEEDAPEAGHTSHDGAPMPEMEEMDQTADTGMAAHREVSQEFLGQLDRAYEAYFEIWKALSQDDTGRASEGAEGFLDAVGKVDMRLLDDETHMVWMRELKILKESANELVDSDDLDASRNAFERLSESLTRVAKTIGTSGKMTILRYFCPMAFDNKGAYWLQNEQGTRNPYFGSMMFKCGEETEVLSE